MKSDPELKGYFAEAADWDADRRALGRRTVRLALTVAGAGWVAVVVLAGALMLLMPLKHVEPSQVTSVSFFKRAGGVADLAQVRYVKSKRAAGSSSEEATHWLATLQYVYADPSSDPKVRAWNPLGFKIVDFRPEPEVVPEAS